MHSLSRRLLISLAVPLVLFFGITIAVLDASVRQVAERGMRDMLDGQMVALIAAVEPDTTTGFSPAERGLETRLSTPGSGLYAQIRAVGYEASWRSESTVGSFIDFGAPLPPGSRRLAYSVQPDGTPVAIASRGIAFEDETGVTRNLTFSVATSLTPYEEQLWSFRTRILGWFLILTLALLATLAVVLRWVLSPVRRLEREINEVEEGTREALGGQYPRELMGVTTNLNALLAAERKRVARYRDTLGNLAHSLKTPLAVMRSSLSATDNAGNGATSGSAGTLNHEIDRMSDIIEHQLKRAAASGGALLGQAPVDVAAMAAELRSALLKVYARKDLSIELAVAPGTHFLGDRGDLMEVLGNLLDNACKWCRSRVKLTASVETQMRARERLCLHVEDDGPGISDANRERVFERGVRADEQVPGHGLGLAMVRDTVDLYGGTLTMSHSELGGSRVTLRLPGR